MGWEEDGRMGGGRCRVETRMGGGRVRGDRVRLDDGCGAALFLRKRRRFGRTDGVAPFRQSSV